MATPTQTPTTTPTISPSESPWEESWTMPERICPQQADETSSPDIAP